MNESKLKEFVNYFVSGDEANAWKFLGKWMYESDSAFIYEDILTMAMRYVGELWEINEITVADEHVASNICNLLISNYSMETIQKKLKNIIGKATNEEPTRTKAM